MRFSTWRMSISVSSWDRRCSSRAFTSNISSTCCFCSSLSGRCAATVSARRPASSMPERDVRISGGIFLFSFTYWSNAESSARRSASTSGAGAASTGTADASAIQCVFPSTTSRMCARVPPSTSTFTVPSGSFSICRMLDTQPIEYMSCGPGSSLAADFCATSRIDFPASIAVSIALIDFGRPTKSGITMWGNTTTSRSGSSGYWLGAVDTISSAMAFPGEGSKTALLGRNAPLQAGPRSRTARRSSGTRHLRRLGVDEKGLAFAHDGIFVHHDLAHVLHRRKIEHDVEQHLLEYGAQAARPGLPRQGLLRDRLQRLRPHFQIDRFHAEEFLVLLDERVLRLRQDLDQSLLVEFLEGRHHRQPADELRNKPILDEVFRLD